MAGLIEDSTGSILSGETDAPSEEVSGVSRLRMAIPLALSVAALAGCGAQHNRGPVSEPKPQESTTTTDPFSTVPTLDNYPGKYQDGYEIKSKNGRFVVFVCTGHDLLRIRTSQIFFRHKEDNGKSDLKYHSYLEHLIDRNSPVCADGKITKNEQPELREHF